MLELLPEQPAEEERPKRFSLMKSLAGRGEDIYDLPSVELSSDGERRKITDFDGRNRLRAMADAGLTAVPVVLKGVEPDVRPVALEGMTGKSMPLKFDPVPKVELPKTEPPTSRSGQFFSGVRTAAEGAQQFIEHMTPGVPWLRARERLQAQADQETAYRLKALEDAGTTRSWPYIAGEAAATLPAAAIAPAAGAGLGGTLLAGAAAGAIGGLTEPVSDPSRFALEKLAQAATGAAVGAPLAGAGRIIGNVLAPTILPAAQRLLDRGIGL